jgi:hypothetical protein
MSDYPNPNLHRSDGVSAKGILITLGVILAVFALLAALGAGTRGSAPVLPAATDDPAATAPSAAQPVTE